MTTESQTPPLRLRLAIHHFEEKQGNAKEIISALFDADAEFRFQREFADDMHQDYLNGHAPQQAFDDAEDAEDKAKAHLGEARKQARPSRVEVIDVDLDPMQKWSSFIFWAARTLGISAEHMWHERELEWAYPGDDYFSDEEADVRVCDVIQSRGRQFRGRRVSLNALAI